MKTFKNKLMSLGLAVVMMAIGLNFNAYNADASGFEITVRKPSPVLCPSETKYGTNCSGNGDGCEPISCDDLPVFEP